MPDPRVQPPARVAVQRLRRRLAVIATAAFVATSAVLASAAVFTSSQTTTTVANALTAYSRAVLADNPVSYWRLDEGSGTTAVDSVGGRNGTYLSDATGTATPGGAALPANAAGSANINAGQIRFPNLPLPTAVGAKATIEFWMFIPNGVDDVITFNATKSLYLYQNLFGFNTSMGDVRGVQSYTVTGRPVHVAAVFENSTSLAQYEADHKLFIDGIQQSGLTYGTSAANPTQGMAPSGYMSGTSPGSTMYRLPAGSRISDLAIYNGELAPAQVQNHYKAGLAYAATVTQTPGLLGYWHLDETSGTAALDYSGNNLAGTYVNDAGGTVALGGAPLARGSKGSTVFNGGTVSLTNLPIPTAAGAKVTIDCWMYVPNVAGLDTTPFAFNLDHAWISSNRFGFNTSNADMYGADATNVVGQTVHVALVYSNDSTAAAYRANHKLYVNGVQQTLTQTMGTQWLNPLSTTMAISGYPGGTTYRLPSGSRISDFAIYNGELTVAQIAEHYNAGR